MKKTPKIEPWKKHTCGECSRGVYVDCVRSRNASGSPFLKQCEFATWGHNPKGQPITLNSVRACEKFNPKEVVVL